MPQLKNSLVMRRQSPEWLDCSGAASPCESGDQDESVHKATAPQQSLHSKACTSSAEHDGSTHRRRHQEALLDTCESPCHSPQIGSKPHAAAQDGVLCGGGGSDAAIERTEPEQPGSIAAVIATEQAEQVQAPSSSAQARPEGVMAASIPAAPVLAHSLPPSPIIRKAQAAEEKQPVLVTAYIVDPQVPGPADALDTTECTATAVEALLGLAELKGVQAHDSQAEAHLEPAEAGEAPLCGETAAQEASAAKPSPDMQIAAAELPAPVPARYEPSEGGQCLDLAQARERRQHSGAAPHNARRSSAVESGESESEGGAAIPVRVCDMTRVSEECLSDLAALAPTAWQRAHSMWLDVPSCSTPQQGHSQTLQAVPKMPSTGRDSGIEQLTLRAQAMRRKIGGLESMRGGPQGGAVQDPAAADASEAATLARPPRRRNRISKELNMLQADGV